MLKIGEFSKLSLVSVRMLRHYEKLGLLVPEKVDSFSGYRYYSVKQLTRINLIIALKGMGLSLSMIKDVLSDFDNQQTLKAGVLKSLEQKEHELNTLNRQISMLKYAKKQIERNDFFMKYNVIEKVVPERKVASLRKKIEHYKVEPDLWKMFFTELKEQSIKIENPPCNVAIYHDEEYSESDQDIEIQTNVTGDYKDTNSICFKDIPAFNVASVTFKGGYIQIGIITQTVLQWIEENGYTLNEDMFPFNHFTIYHMDPATMGEDYADWVIEVCYPINK